MGGAEGKCMWIDTGNTFRSEITVATAQRCVGYTKRFSFNNNKKRIGPSLLFYALSPNLSSQNISLLSFSFTTPFQIHCCYFLGRECSVNYVKTGVLQIRYGPQWSSGEYCDRVVLQFGASGNLNYWHFSVFWPILIPYPLHIQSGRSQGQEQRSLKIFYINGIILQ